MTDVTHCVLRTTSGMTNFSGAGWVPRPHEMARSSRAMTCEVSLIRALQAGRAVGRVGMPTFRIELSLGGRVAGIDEAGRGPLAGPVVAAAMMIEPKRLPRSLVRKIDDSKQMSREAREEVFEKL